MKKMEDRKAKKPGSSTGATRQLNREQIVSAALALVDREGLGALSMRRLGAELGVDPMAVYYYIPNKKALLDAIVEAVMASIDLRVDDPALPFEERILACVQAYAEVMLAHRNALPILLSRGPVTPASLHPVETLTAILRDAGLEPLEALAGMNTLAAATRGLVGMMAREEEVAGEDCQLESEWEQLTPGQFPCLEEAMRKTHAFCKKKGKRACRNHIFEFGMRALARGLVAGADKKRNAKKK